jgi:hypothetical protein
MLLSRHQNAGQNHNIQIGDRSFENVTQFKYLGTAATNQNFIHEVIKSTLNSGIACYHSLQNALSCRLLSKNVKIKICKTVLLPVVLYGCGTKPLALKGKHRLKAFENRMLRRIFGSKRDEMVED